MSKSEIPLLNRELSALSFNARVLQEANDATVPLMECVKFLGIASSNIDEFFRVRVASIERLSKIEGVDGEYGFSSKLILQQLIQEVLRQQDKQEDIVFNQIVPELAKNNVFLLNEAELNPAQRKHVVDYVNANLMSALVPVILTGGNKFPFIKDSTNYLLVEMGRKNAKIKNSLALIEIPENMPRFFEEKVEEKHFIMLLDDIIRTCLPNIFSFFEFDFFRTYSFKITRDADLDISSDFSDNILKRFTRAKSKLDDAITTRLIYDRAMPKRLLSYLVEKLKVDETALIPAGKYRSLRDLMNFPKVQGEGYYYDKLIPIPHPDFDGARSLLSVIAKKDVLLCFPYQSFDYVVQFLREAAIDPKVKSIKMALYRVSKDSRIINALIRAAQNGKKVTVFFEVKARFDEFMNIHESELLRRAGVKVVQEIKNYKVHSKICLIERTEGKKTSWYANLATGNFSESAAKMYSDYSLFTTNEAIITDLINVFKCINKGKVPAAGANLLIAPRGIRVKLQEFIRHEMFLAKQGLPAYIILKLNSLTDAKIIADLYAASQVGVKIDLIVRGSNCLMAGILGLSENIKIISVVDRYLEHGRVFIFGNGGNEKMYLTSADIMLRNLDRRVEVAFPIIDLENKKIIRDIINLQLSDNVKARLLTPEMDNEIVKNDKEPCRSQLETYNYFLKK